MLTNFDTSIYSDRMHELRQIQQGERPVTGTDSRDNINSFFAKRLDAQAAAQGKENVPVNVDDVEEHRPDTVVVEIQGLVDQHRVSNVLTTNFRRRLENIIRGSISTVTRNNSPRPSPQSSARPTPSPQNSERQSPVPAPRSSTTPPISGSQSPVPQPRLRNTAIPQHVADVTDRSRSNSLASTNSSSSCRFHFIYLILLTYVIDFKSGRNRNFVASASLYIYSDRHARIMF